MATKKRETEITDAKEVMFASGRTPLVGGKKKFMATLDLAAALKLQDLMAKTGKSGTAIIRDLIMEAK